MQQGRSIMRRACIAVVALAMGVAVSAQNAKPRPPAPAAAQAKFKAIWEPVNYSEDLVLEDVAFVAPDLGWVAGRAGTILMTRDGGMKWEAELGGDPASKEATIERLFFLNETTGWATQRTSPIKLLRRDAQGWQQAGTMQTSWGLVGYAFTSATNGVYVDANDNVARVMHTADGGKSWKEVFRCRDKVMVDGLARQIDCNLKALHFPTPQVGYAIGGAHGVKNAVFVAKTTDGGASWSVWNVPDVGAALEVYGDKALWFTSEMTGYAVLAEDKIYMTADGGKTWRGLIGSGGRELRFPDSDVGWSFRSFWTLTYTVDAGKRWASRDFKFPTPVRAFSIPRRDRAYVVGEHGMVYRYRIVPVDYTAKGLIDAPAMPAP